MAVSVPRDANRIPGLVATSSTDGVTPVVVWADPITHRLLVSFPSGIGFVVGPSSSTDKALARFDGTTGELIQNSTVILDDTGNITGVETLEASTSVSVGAMGTASGALVLSGTTSGAVTLSVADAAGTWTMKFPVDAGSNNYVLATDGSGNTSWVAIGGSITGSIADTQVAYGDGTDSIAGSDNFRFNGNDLTLAQQKRILFGAYGNETGQIYTDSSDDLNISTVSLQKKIFIDGSEINIATNAGGGNTINIGHTGSTLALIGTLGSTGTRVVKGWFTDLEVTNSIVGSITGTATNLSGTPALPNGTAATTQAPFDGTTKLATTAYVDAAIVAQNYKEGCKYATTAALASVTYSNGSSGVGATLTAVGLGAISIDGATPSVADRILVKNQVSQLQNGIYTVTVVGSAGTAFVLTRATDFDQSSEIKTGDASFVTSGSTLASTTWAYTGSDSPTMGTDAIPFAQIAGPGSFTSGNGISITGTSIAIDTSVTVDKTTVQTLTNKTLTSSTDVLGGVTMTLGSDASYDMYYRNSSGVLTRLANGTTGQVLTATTSNAPSWAAASGGSSVVMTMVTDFAASGRYLVTNAGSGSTTFDNTGASVSTSGTGTSSSKVRWTLPNGLNVYAGSPTVSIAMYFSDIGTTSTCYFGLGQPTIDGSGITYTVRHIGGKAVTVSSTCSIYATQADGTTETASAALTTLSANDGLDFIFKINDTSSVDYYWRKNGGSLSSATNLSANMPNTSEANATFQISNQATATNTSVSFGTCSYIR